MILTQMLICFLGRIITELIELAQTYCLKVYGDRDTSNWKCPLGSLLYGLSEQKEDVSASQEIDVYWQPTMCQELFGVM